MAVRWGWIDTNPVTALNKRALKASRPRTRFLSPAELDQLLAATAGHIRPAIILAVETGIRKEELFSLTLSRIDLTRREIRLDHTKSGVPRRVPLSDKAITTIKAATRSPGQRPNTPYLFAKADGSRFVDMKNGFVAACKRAGLTDFRWHDLRHTFASWFVQDGGDLYHLSRILGHATVQMTTRYGHLRTDDLHAELRRVAQNRTQEHQISSTAGNRASHIMTRKAKRRGLLPAALLSRQTEPQKLMTLPSRKPCALTLVVRVGAGGGADRTGHEVVGALVDFLIHVFAEYREAGRHDVVGAEGDALGTPLADACQHHVALVPPLLDLCRPR